MGTIAPPDLLDWRADMMREIGFTNPVEIGIVGDAAHAARGGYHISVDDIFAAGKSGEYSTRLARDRHRPDPYASAGDLGDNWPRGGRSAWLRFNNNVVWELMHNPGNLPGLRGMNYTPDGTTRLRYDREHPAEPTSSTDTVTIHTHLEWYRDTRGKRQACLNRLVEHVLMAQGRFTGSANPPTTSEEADMTLFTATNVPAGTKDVLGNAVTENTRVMLTPNGPIAMLYGEIIAAYTASPASFLPATWVRLNAMASALKQPVVQSVVVTPTDEQWADFKAGAVPIVHDAAESGARDGVQGAWTLRPADQ